MAKVKIIMIHGDAEKILPKLGGKKFNLIIADPPYNVLRADTAYTKWDKNELNWHLVFRHFYRILKDDGYVFLFGVISMFLKLYERFKDLFKIWFDLVWVKPAPVNFLMAKKKPMNRHELILCLKKIDGKVGTYNYREIGYYGKPYRVSGRKWSRLVKLERENYLTQSIDGFRYPTTVLEVYTKTQMPREERTEHPTQKPLPLIEWIIKGFSNKNDWILDPFMGTGTTCVAAKRLERNCVGIEVDKRWYDVALMRVKRGV